MQEPQEQALDGSQAATVASVAVQLNGGSYRSFGEIVCLLAQYDYEDRQGMNPVTS